MSEVIKSVSDIISDQTKNLQISTQTKGTDALGKDAFMQLLVAQMKYQDPLNPSQDTEYISQLATFSQLEQMQNLNATNTNSQALSLVGKQVVVKMTDATGKVTYQDGFVDYVTLQNGKAKLSIDDKLFGIEDLVEVYDEKYLKSLGRPTVEQQELSFDAKNPKDVSVKVDLGTTSVANALAVVINGNVIDSSHLSLENGALTIKGEAFEKLGNGTYNMVFLFNDELETTVSNKVSLTVTNAV